MPVTHESPSVTPDQSLTFPQKEYEALRAIILEALRETWTLERYSVIAVAAFWTWVFAQDEWREWMRIARFLPVVVVTFAGLRSLTLFLFLRHIGAYLKSREVTWGLGWERFRSEQNIGRLLALATAFWAVLFCLSLWIAFAFDATWLVGASKKH